MAFELLGAVGCISSKKYTIFIEIIVKLTFNQGQDLISNLLEDIEASQMVRNGILLGPRATREFIKVITGINLKFDSLLPKEMVCWVTVEGLIVSQRAAALQKSDTRLFFNSIKNGVRTVVFNVEARRTAARRWPRLYP